MSVRIYKINNINEKITNFADSVVTQLYDSVKNDVVSNQDYNTRHEKMIFIKNNLCYVGDELLDELELLVKNIYLKDVRTKTIFDILNKILIEMGIDEIDDLRNFPEIERNSLSDEKYKNIVMDSFKQKHSGFNKSECCDYQKRGATNNHISILKSMIKSIDYELLSGRKYHLVDGKRITKTVYYIKKTEPV